MQRWIGSIVIAATLAFAAAGAPAAPPNWVTTWAASAHGPFPIGNPSAPPEPKFAFPNPTEGAEDQTFRMIVRPDLWGPRARLRFSNAFGKAPLAIDNATVALQTYAGNVARGTLRSVTFGGKPGTSIAPGAVLWSDAIELPFARDAQALRGRKLAGMDLGNFECCVAIHFRAIESAQTRFFQAREQLGFG